MAQTASSKRSRRQLLKDDGVDSGGNCRNITRDQVPAQAILGRPRQISWRAVCRAVAAAVDGGTTGAAEDERKRARLVDTVVCGSNGTAEFYLTSDFETGLLRKVSLRQRDLNFVASQFDQWRSSSLASSSRAGRGQSEDAKIVASTIDEGGSIALLDRMSFAQLVKTGLSHGIQTLSVYVPPKGGGNGTPSPCHSHCNFRYVYQLDHRACPVENKFRLNVGRGVTGSSAPAMSSGSMPSKVTSVNRRMGTFVRFLVSAVETKMRCRVTKLVSDFVHDAADNVWMIRTVECEVADEPRDQVESRDRGGSTSRRMQDAHRIRSEVAGTLSIEVRQGGNDVPGAPDGNYARVNGMDGSYTDEEINGDGTRARNDGQSAASYRCTNEMTAKYRNAFLKSEMLGSTQLEHMCKGDFCGYDIASFVPSFSDLASDEDTKQDTNSIDEKNGSAPSIEFRNRLCKLEREESLKEEVANSFDASTICGRIPCSNPTFDLPQSVIIQARQEKHLVDVLVRKHREGNREVGFSSCTPTEECLLAESFPGHYYRSVKVCKSCYDVYTLIESARKPEVSSRENRNPNKPASTSTRECKPNSRNYENTTVGSRNTINHNSSLQRARRAISCLSKADLSEIRSFVKPPPAVEMATAALMVALKGSSLDWKSSRAVFSNIDRLFHDMLQVGSVMNAAREKELERYIRNPHFRPNDILPISKAGAKLCAWVLGVVLIYKWNSGRILHEHIDPLQRFDSFSKVIGGSSTLPSIQNCEWHHRDCSIPIQPNIDAKRRENPIVGNVRCRGDGRRNLTLHQRRRMCELAGSDRPEGPKAPATQTLLCADGTTRITYEVLGREEVLWNKASFVVCHDLFDCLDMTKLLFMDVLKKNPGCRVLVFNQPGQAGTTFVKNVQDDSGDGPSLNNDFHAEKLHELLTHVHVSGEFNVKTMPFHLVGIGSGLPIALSFADLHGRGRAYRDTLKSIVSVNGFASIDPQLAAILYSTKSALQSFPVNRPDLPVSFFTQYLFSDDYVEKITRNLALNIYTAVTNPISLEGRLSLTSGVLKNRDVSNVAKTLDLPIVAIQSTENSLIHPSNVDTILNGRDISHVWSHQIQSDAGQGESCYERTSLGNFLRPSFGTQKSVAIFVRAGHALAQEHKRSIVDLLKELASLNGISHEIKTTLPLGKKHDAAVEIQCAREGTSRTHFNRRIDEGGALAPDDRPLQLPQHAFDRNDINACAGVYTSDSVDGAVVDGETIAIGKNKDFETEPKDAITKEGLERGPEATTSEEFRIDTSECVLAKVDLKGLFASPDKKVTDDEIERLDSVESSETLRGDDISESREPPSPMKSFVHDLTGQDQAPPKNVCSSTGPLADADIELENDTNHSGTLTDDDDEVFESKSQRSPPIVDSTIKCSKNPTQTIEQLNSALVNQHSERDNITMQHSTGSPHVTSCVAGPSGVGHESFHLKIGHSRAELSDTSCCNDYTLHSSPNSIESVDQPFSIGKGMMDQEVLDTSGDKAYLDFVLDCCPTDPEASNSGGEQSNIADNSMCNRESPTALEGLLHASVPLECISSDVLVSRPDAGQKKTRRWVTKGGMDDAEGAARRDMLHCSAGLKTVQSSSPPTAEELLRDASDELEFERRREKECIELGRFEKSDLLTNVQRDQDARRNEYAQEDKSQLEEIENLRRWRNRAKMQMQRLVDVDEAEEKLVQDGLVPEYKAADGVHPPVRTLPPMVYSFPRNLPSHVAGDGIRNVFNKLERDASESKKLGVLRVDEFEKLKSQMAQQHLEKEKRLRSLEEAEQQRLFSETAILIQRFVRGYFARVKSAVRREKHRALSQKADAAVQIQRCTRGFFGRKRAGARRELELMQVVLGSSAVTIQKVWRGRNGRRLALRARTRRAAETLCRVLLGHSGRLKARRARERILQNKLLHDSALKIQCAWKVKVAWEEYRTLRIYRMASTEIQRVLRGRFGRKRAARVRKWEMTEPGPERIKLGLELIQESKDAFDRQQEEIDFLHRDQEKAETRISQIYDELKESEQELSLLEKELEGIDHMENDIIELTRNRAASTDRNGPIAEGWDSESEKHMRGRGIVDHHATEQLIRIKRAEREKKKRQLEIEFGQVLSEVEQKRNSLGHLELAITDMEETRRRKDREFGRLQRNLMELLHEQKNELDRLREKGIELETATATSAAAAAATAQRALEHEKRTGKLFNQQEELMKFQFMSMSLSYFSSLKMLQQMRSSASDATAAAVTSSADMAATAAAAAAAANIPGPATNRAAQCENHATETKIAEKEAQLRRLQDRPREGAITDDKEQLPLDCRQWTIRHVSMWLRQLSLGVYVEKFEEACVDGEFLLELREEDLASVLSVEHKLHRRKILLARQKLQPLSPGEAVESDCIAGQSRSLRQEVNAPDANAILSQVRHGRLKRLQEGLDDGLDIETTDEQDNSLLLVAAQNGHKKLVEFLVRRGANVNHVNKSGNSALHYALAYDKTGLLAEYLIENGADDTVENLQGLTPYDWGGDSMI